MFELIMQSLQSNKLRTQTKSRAANNFPYGLQMNVSTFITATSGTFFYITIENSKKLF